MCQTVNQSVSQKSVRARDQPPTYTHLRTHMCAWPGPFHLTTWDYMEGAKLQLTQLVNTGSPKEHLGSSGRLHLFLLGAPPLKGLWCVVLLCSLLLLDVHTLLRPVWRWRRAVHNDDRHCAAVTRETHGHTYVRTYSAACNNTRMHMDIHTYVRTHSGTYTCLRRQVHFDDEVCT